MFDVLAAAVEDLEKREDLRVLLIAAEGRYFTSGVDITTMDGDPDHPDGVASGSSLRRSYRERARHDLFDRLESVEKPVVLAVQGPCVGVGVELAASCDFRLVSVQATFALPELANLAVVPGSGGISRLTRIIGPHWTKWLVVAGETVDAEQALAIGLVHAVYQHEEFMERVQAFTRHLARQPGEAAGLAKLMIDAALNLDRRMARDLDRIVQTTLLTSPEHLDRVRRFSVRRREG
jgi:enoyl-CoA hydratase/carnithine racemase